MSLHSGLRARESVARPQGSGFQIEGLTEVGDLPLPSRLFEQTHSAFVFSSASTPRTVDNPAVPGLMNSVAIVLPGAIFQIEPRPELPMIKRPVRSDVMLSGNMFCVVSEISVTRSALRKCRRLGQRRDSQPLPSEF